MSELSSEFPYPLSAVTAAPAALQVKTGAEGSEGAALGGVVGEGLFGGEEDVKGGGAVKDGENEPLVAMAADVAIPKGQTDLASGAVNREGGRPRRLEEGEKSA